VAYSLDSETVEYQFSIQEQLLYRNVQRFREGLVFEAHRLLYQSTLDLGVIKKRREYQEQEGGDALSGQRSGRFLPPDPAGSGRRSYSPVLARTVRLAWCAALKERCPPRQK